MSSFGGVDAHYPHLDELFARITSQTECRNDRSDFYDCQQDNSGSNSDEIILQDGVYSVDTAL